jgi:hypothetical protein
LPDAIQVGDTTASAATCAGTGRGIADDAVRLRCLRRHHSQMPIQPLLSTKATMLPMPMLMPGRRARLVSRSTLRARTTQNAPAPSPCIQRPCLTHRLPIPLNVAEPTSAVAAAAVADVLDARTNGVRSCDARLCPLDRCGVWSYTARPCGAGVNDARRPGCCKCDSGCIRLRSMCWSSSCSSDFEMPSGARKHSESSASRAYPTITTSSSNGSSRRYTADQPDGISVASHCEESMFRERVLTAQLSCEMVCRLKLKLPATVSGYCSQSVPAWSSSWRLSSVPRQSLISNATAVSEACSYRCSFSRRTA